MKLDGKIQQRSSQELPSNLGQILHMEPVIHLRNVFVIRISYSAVDKNFARPPFSRLHSLALASFSNTAFHEATDSTSRRRARPPSRARTTPDTRSRTRFRLDVHATLAPALRLAPEHRSKPPGEPRRLRRPGTRPILGFRRARARLRARARGPYAGWTSLDSRSERSASDTPRGPASRVCTRPIDAFNTPHANSGRRVKPPSIFPSLLHISRQGTGTTTTSDGSHERLPANQPLVAGVIRTFQPPRPPTRRRDDPRGDESGTSRGYFPRLAGIFPRDVRGRRAAVDDGARHDGIRLG